MASTSGTICSICRDEENVLTTKLPCCKQECCITCLLVNLRENEKLSRCFFCRELWDSHQLLSFCEQCGCQHMTLSTICPVFLTPFDPKPLVSHSYNHDEFRGMDSFYHDLIHYHVCPICRDLPFIPDDNERLTIHQSHLRHDIQIQLTHNQWYWH